jgi:hypothetical protein
MAGTELPQRLSVPQPEAIQQAATDRIRERLEDRIHAHAG